MQPVDTTFYLILGSAAVFVPLLLYVLSLLLRTRTARTRLQRLQSSPHAGHPPEPRH